MLDLEIRGFTSLATAGYSENDQCFREPRAIRLKFIHAADIHLDSPLRGLSAYPEAPADRLRKATREALERLVLRAVQEEVDFLIIAGDIFDGTWKDFHTGLFFVRQMGRLRQAGIPVYILYGNHDAESEMTLSLEWPDNVHRFSSDKTETFLLEDRKVALHGRSFKVAKTTENLAQQYPPPVSGWLNIGVLHTALEGNAAHATYAPCSVAELEARGYQYWALGHVHEHWMKRGPVTIAYPGNLQGRHIRETGPRGALLVTVEDQEVRDVQRLEVDVLRWHMLEVSLTGIPDFEGAVRATGVGMDRVLEATPDHLALVCRIVLEGCTAAHASLVAQETRLRAEVIAQAVARAPDRLWIEKVTIATTPLEAGPDPLADGLDGALAILADLARNPSCDPEFLNRLLKDWKEPFERLPHEVLEASAELQELQGNPMSQAGARLEQALSMLMGRLGRDARLVD